MSDRKEKVGIFISLMLILSIISLFVENGLYQSDFTRLFTNILDYIIFILFLSEIVTGFIRTKYKILFLKQNIFEVTFLIIFSVLFVYTKYVGFLIDSQRLKNLSKYLIIIRNVFIFIKVFGRVKKFNTLINRVASLLP